MKRAIMLGVLALTFHSGAFAQEAGTAQDLYGQCFRSEPICGSYLMGVATVMLLIGKTYQSRRREHDVVGPFGAFAICASDEPITSITLPKIFATWLDKHPERKQGPMGSAAMEFFHERWPCERRRESK